MSKKIVVAGHISLDITPSFGNKENQSFAQLLKPGKLTDVGLAQISTGGAVSNTGLALHKLGSDVVLNAKVGDDLFGEILRNKIKEQCGCNIKVSKGESTSYTIVIAPIGCDRAFLHNSGCNNTFTCYDIDWDIISQAQYFHFGYPTIMKQFYKENGKELINLYKKLKNKGIVTSLDLSSIDPNSESGRCDWDLILKKVLPYVDFFVPSIEELGFMIDKKRYETWQQMGQDEDIMYVLSLENDIKPIAEKALSYGCKAVLLKCGVAGMYLKTSSQEDMLQVDEGLVDWGNVEIFQDSFVPDRVLSATGAGDTSIAAFLKAVMEEKSPKESLEYAAATGACCVTTYDTISGLQPFEVLRRRIQAGWKQQHIVKE